MSSESFVSIYNPLGSDFPAYEKFCDWRKEWKRPWPFSLGQYDWVASDNALYSRPLLSAYVPHIAGRLEQTNRAGVFFTGEISEHNTELAAQARSFVTE